ncbi:ribonuclease [Rhodoferax sp.]|uniref:ribonuclease n=1 Tax=Rhodoferax sp. TaxID=50421 RepID=UPI0026070B53|nr:ribonuclease [Rhodoferax sp.]MDD2810451.1 ribonuclease [Rhodoferax sp.]MDD4944498.1 ribonuclease [Rhodoferax sp.]
MLQKIKLKWVWASLAVVLACTAVLARAPAPAGVFSTISLRELPAQGVQTYTLIFQGGPFASEKDGVVFGNRERILPMSKRGYYREYTVPTPGLKHRGTRRIVCGGRPTTPDICYYTADHYASFRKIEP